MSEADKMFEKLGYIKDEGEGYIVYFKHLKLGRENQIEFNLIYKTVEKRRMPKLESLPINSKELQAINKKVEELEGI